MKFPCPCCGYLTSSAPGSYDICPVCGWEDDISQLRFPTMDGGANEHSLIEAQKMATFDPGVTAQFELDEKWRPIDLNKDTFEDPDSNIEYGNSYPSDKRELYYWLKN